MRQVSQTKKRPFGTVLYVCLTCRNCPNTSATLLTNRRTCHPCVRLTCLACLNCSKAAKSTGVVIVSLVSLVSIAQKQQKTTGFAGVAQRPEILPGAVLLLGGLEGREAPALSGPPGHADGPSSASPGEVVVGQLDKVVQHGADCVVLVAVPLVVREPQSQLLRRHIAAATRRSGAPAGGPSERACCRPRGPRSTSGARALRRSWVVQCSRLFSGPGSGTFRVRSAISR